MYVRTYVYNTAAKNEYINLYTICERDCDRVKFCETTFILNYTY